MYPPPGLSTKIDHPNRFTKLNSSRLKKHDFQEISHLSEVNSFAEDDSWDKECITVTIDSGASDSVMNKNMAKDCKMRPSEGSRSGVKYLAAGGEVIKNEGEKKMAVRTEEGHTCNLNMQITAVNKALLSVSKICDAGHEVVFHKHGGRIVNQFNGQQMNFSRENGVYRMKLHVLGDAATTYFQRQGK